MKIIKINEFFFYLYFLICDFIIIHIFHLFIYSIRLFILVFPYVFMYLFPHFSFTFILNISSFICPYDNEGNVFYFRCSNQLAIKSRGLEKKEALKSFAK